MPLGGVRKGTTTMVDEMRQENATPDRETVQRLRARIERPYEGIEARAVTEQAVGVLMAWQRCGPETAFKELVRRPQSANVELRDIAAEVFRDLVD
jgi:AmiR/NasT family two-component response regulator